MRDRFDEYSDCHSCLAWHSCRLGIWEWHLRAFKSGAPNFWLFLIVCENTWAYDPTKIHNQVSVNFKKHVTLLSPTLEPAIWHVIMVSRCLVLTAVNWPLNGSPIWKITMPTCNLDQWFGQQASNRQHAMAPRTYVRARKQMPLNSMTMKKDIMGFQFLCMVFFGLSIFCRYL